MPPVPEGFKVSKNTLNKLPEGERADAATHLWTKSAGLCALCDQPLPNETGLIEEGEVEADHHIPEHGGAGGPTVLKNLYLAHKSCNRRRRDLPFRVAHAVIAFATWVDRKGRVTFDDVLNQYVKPANLGVRVTRDGSEISVDYGGTVLRSPVAIDPATKTEYFFTEVPTAYLHNDREVQPRLIEADHVSALAQDFVVRPVHEPSNCRLIPGVGDTARLMQFDGQHKSTAQIILGRTSVPTKVYIEPAVPMIQELVISIQQRIKKRPLSTSDTLIKLGDVVAERLSQYVAKPGQLRSEQGYIASQPLEMQKARRAEWLQELERLVFMDPANKLHRFVGTKRSPQFPTTDSVVISKLIRPFIFQGLLAEDMEQVNGRDHEHRAILIILNSIVERFLDEGWQPASSAVLRRRAQNFLYQGSIGWWVSQILRPAIIVRLEIPKADHVKPFLKPLQPEHEDKLRELIDTIAAWDVWSLDDASPAVKAMKSNVSKDVAASLPEYTEWRLLREAIG